jgi:hypothetical protein
VAQLYPQALGSLFVTSYDSQGYGGGIRPPPPHGDLVPDRLFTNYSAYNISDRTAQKTLYHYCCAIVALEKCLFVEPLLSNGFTCHSR